MTSNKAPVCVCVCARETDREREREEFSHDREKNSHTTERKKHTPVFGLLLIALGITPLASLSAGTHDIQ